jgi:hypothetical protein
MRTKMLLAWPAERLVEFLRTLNGCAGSADQSILPTPARNRIEARALDGLRGRAALVRRPVRSDPVRRYRP